MTTGSVLLLLPLSSVLGFPLYEDTANGRAATHKLYSFTIEIWFGANAMIHPWLYILFEGTADWNWFSVVVSLKEIPVYTEFPCLKISPPHRHSFWDCCCLIAHTFGIGLLLIMLEAAYWTSIVLSHSVQCILCTVHCALYCTVHFTLYTVHTILNTVQCQGQRFWRTGTMWRGSFGGSRWDLFSRGNRVGELCGSVCTWFFKVHVHHETKSSLVQTRRGSPVDNKPSTD